MLLARSAAAATRRVAFASTTRRAFSAGLVRSAGHGHDAHGHGHGHVESTPKHDLSAKSAPLPVVKGTPNIPKKLEEIESDEDLIPEGAAPGTVPTDIEQATGLERLEILGKMQGIDIFDMKPLPSDRLGTLKEPVLVKSFGEEQYCGCTGVPADSHHVKWLTISRDRPLGRCPECGSCYMMEYVGEEHVHEAERTEPEPVNFSNFIKPDYYYR